jgi:hypothetical protein
MNEDIPDFLEGVDFGTSTLESHLATPEVSYEDYRRKKELECADIVMARKAVYLDTRFWIHLRDAELGKPISPIFVQLLTVIRRGVAEGKLVCPFAADMLAEVYKQSDRTTRLATALLIDELSLNVALKSEPERLSIELHHGIQAVRSNALPQEPLNRLVWTYPSFVVGHTKPNSTAFDAATELAVQKSFLDYMSRLSFSHQVLGIKEDATKLGKFNQMWDELAERLNHLNAANSDETKLRKQIKTDEFTGALEACIPALQDVIRKIFMCELNEHTNDQMEAGIERVTNQIGGMICEAFRLGRLKNNFPTLTIRSALATAVRWDQKRKYKRNDFHDFGHAAAALPYFDVFATEKSLRHLLVTDLKFDAKFAVAIECDPEAILERLNAD